MMIVGLELFEVVLYYTQKLDQSMSGLFQFRSLNIPTRTILPTSLN